MNPRAGGAERTIHEVCTRLIKKDYLVTILTGGWKGCRREEHLDGITIYRYGRSLGPHLVLPIFIFKYKFDIIVNDLGHAVPWISSAVLGKENLVFFHHLHARSVFGQVNPLLAWIITAIEKLYFLIYHNAPFVTESSTSHNDLLNLGIDKKNIIIIPPGVDRELFKPTKKTPYPSMVYFGGMRRYKRPVESIYLLKNLQRKFPDIKLMIIGTGPEKENMEKLSVDMKLQNSITFMGRLTNKNLTETVASSWINVHSSITEGWGFSIIEAAAAGTPTVAYEVPGVVDAIENGINGIKVRDGDRNELKRAAIEILSTAEKWSESSVRSAEKYSWNRTAEMWEKLIRDLDSDKICLLH